MFAWNHVLALCMISLMLGFFISCVVFYHANKCNHHYEKIYEGEKSFAHVIVYRCSKCGKVQRVKVK